MNRKEQRSHLNGEKVQLGLMESFGFLFVIAFVFVPFIGIIIAFLDYRPGWSLSDSTFVGLENFIEMFSGGNQFLLALPNAFPYPYAATEVKDFGYKDGQEALEDPRGIYVWYERLKPYDLAAYRFFSGLSGAAGTDQAETGAALYARPVSGLLVIANLGSRPVERLSVSLDPSLPHATVYRLYKLQVRWVRCRTQAPTSRSTTMSEKHGSTSPLSLLMAVMPG